MSDSLKQKTANGFWWSAIERFSVQGVTFLVGVLIARQLAPTHYGQMAMLNVFITLASVFVDSGFSSALIRKIDRSEADVSTAFFFNVVVGFLASGMLYMGAPLIGSFYRDVALVSLMRVLSVSLALNSLGAVQQSLLSTQLDFKTLAKTSLISSLLSGGLGVWGAYTGWGVWALVAQAISSSALRTLLLWIFGPWFPRSFFSLDSFKNLFGFGSRLMASALLDSAYNNLYALVIGKFFSSPDLGYYSRANQLAQFPSSNMTSVIQRVTFPVLSQMQNDTQRLAYSYEKLLRFSVFFIFPMMIGLAAVAEPFVSLVLTEKWLGAVIYLQILSFALMWYPIHAINLNLLQVKGRSDLFLRLEIIKKAIGVAILLLSIPMGLLAMCWGLVATSLLCLGVNTYYTGKLIGTGFIRQARDVAPSLMATLAMGMFVHIFIGYFDSASLRLGIGILAGIVFYVAITFFFKFPEWDYLRTFVQPDLRKST